METRSPPTKGLVLHSEARYYDLLAWLLTLGRERAFRERLVNLAALSSGEVVLDMGCGTGTLAITAKRRVGPSGSVTGIDASPEMIARASRKAMNAREDVRFQTAIVEALPFPDASFDVVFSTLMLHHLPRPVREQCAREMRRVLRPNGRVLAVDFVTPARERKGLLAHLHRHGSMSLPEIIELLSSAGLRVTESGAVGVSDVHFVKAIATIPNEAPDGAVSVARTRSLPSLPTPRWVWGVLAVVVLATHAIIIRGTSSRLTLSTLAMLALVVLAIALHSGLAGVCHTVLSRRHPR